MSIQTTTDGVLPGKVEKPAGLRLRNPRGTSRRFFLGILLPLFILGFWQFLSAQQYADPALFPAPSSIVKELYNMIATGELQSHLKVSVLRAFFGFLIGGSAGLITGLLVGMFNKVEEVLDPTVQMVRAIPILAITPLFILWFGYGEVSKILLISLASFFPLYINTFLGVRNVDSKLFDVAKVLEFNRAQQMLRLVIPAAMPNFLLGLRLSISFSWMVLVSAELMGAEKGVGYLIQDARSFMRTEVVFIGIFLFAAVGKLSDSFVRLLEQRLLKWQDTYKG